MDNVIKLHGDPHEQTQMLLPWYVNGTLGAAEAAMVEAHLSECTECRQELRFERAMERRMEQLSVDVEHGWAAMAKRLDAAAESAPAADIPVPNEARVIPFLRRRITLGWAITGQAAAAVLALVAMGSLRQANDVADYHALGAAGDRTGNLVVTFRPETTEREIRALLDTAQARVVEGPLTSGAWILQVGDVRRDTAVGQLRASPRVTLLEPLDDGGQP